MDSSVAPAPTAETIEAFTERSKIWLDDHAKPLGTVTTAGDEHDVSVFRDMSHDDERALLDGLMAWQQAKFDAGFGALTSPVEWGGAALGASYERAFRSLEANYELPGHHETFSVTRYLVAPTVLAYGTHEQKERFVRRFLRTEELCCQLFSEPGAGSDLAGLSTRAVRDGDEWVINGQKTWTSGAMFSQWGELIARSDPDVPKHKGQTAFVIPMDTPGVTVVPIRQMTGGATFNEVFFDDARVPDSLRLGPVGEGWKVALTTLGFERDHSGTNDHVGGSWAQVRELAERLDATDSPTHRQALARLYTLHKVRQAHNERIQTNQRGGGTPGPEASANKLLWTRWLAAVSDVVADLLGPRIVADTGDAGSYRWNDHLLGAPGYRIAGGSDEIQHNIIGERVLGLPGEPRVDRDVPFRDVPR
ncbi:MAG TPA: acyl-CoA dehydrogenase family protein [Acidimicrobiales bacterium]|nr:acyl-CoA dehydrogenase family protein [Acidimicrobiales bacterium]